MGSRGTLRRLAQKTKPKMIEPIKKLPVLFVPQNIRYEIAPFIHGKGLCYGTKGTPISNPHAKTKDFYTIYGDKERVLSNAAVVEQQEFFGMFAKHTMDHVVLGPLADKSQAAIKWAKDRLKFGGVLVVFGEEKPSGGLGVVEIGGWYLHCSHPDFNAKTPNNSVAIIRYGALGDLVMITPLLEACKAANEYVVLYTSPYALAVLENNPHIDRLLVQEKDIIAIGELGEYFKYIQTKYGRFVDLCESIEGSMLKLESRAEFYMPKAWRDETCGENYYRKTLRLGGHPNNGEGVIVGKFYQTKPELVWASQEYQKLSEGGQFFVWAWAIHGTSHHKNYPLMKTMLHEYFEYHPDEKVVLLGSPEHMGLAFEHPQVVNKIGQYSIRQTIGFLGTVDGVVSPESFIANAGAAHNKPVITLLSHSSRENLCSTWKYDYSLEPDALFASCFPCHQLHYTPQSCPQRDMIDTDTQEVVAAGAACTIGAIPMHVLAEQMDKVRNAFRPKNKDNPQVTS